MNFIKWYFFIGITLITIPDCNAQDTLRNIPDAASLSLYKYSSSCYGYFTGQNCYGREVYAEKYYINGTTTVSGLISHLTGNIQMPDRLLSFELYAVGPDCLPYQRLVTKEIRYGDLILNGGPNIIMFDSPVTVTDSFFVACNFSEYIHDAFTDTIGLYCGNNGSRPDSDLIHKGRNAVKLHHIGWSDFYAKTGLKTNLALFPILTSSPIPTSVGDLFWEEQFFSITYTGNPEEIQISYLIKNSTHLSIELYDLTGKRIKEIYSGYKTAGKYTDELILKNTTENIYLLLFHSDKETIIKKVFIRR